MHAPAHHADESAWMAEALREARRARDAGEVPVGAVVVVDGDIVGSGHNTTEERDDPCGHAEINALRKAGASTGDWRLEGAMLVVTLEPCAMCMGAIALARIEQLVYGAADTRLGACGSTIDLSGLSIAPHLKSVQGGIMAEECSRLLKDFFQGLR